ncbi:UNVERIFIED_CONTAM: hypothetical protein Slati_4534300 [Sesamum latifolium]|uniref:Integrase catalytic domain-containing protein n=1 Tax=Sesamum latifolium TaxID=2727402 RepID=A0AAW2SHF6_9LAMI
MSADFFQYCDNNGIRRQMTCPNTPQQNGVAKRKLAHLISTSLSWLHDKNLPRELWAEAIRCACYVINRLLPWPVEPNLTQRRKSASLLATTLAGKGGGVWIQ